jgi:hypothetical protein
MNISSTTILLTFHPKVGSLKTDFSITAGLLARPAFAYLLIRPDVSGANNGVAEQKLNFRQE